jgi:hypothetical protein
VKPTNISLYVLPLALALAMLAAGCKGEEKPKPATPAARAPPPGPTAERPQAVAPEKPAKKERTGGKVVKSVVTPQGKLQIVRYGSGASAEFAALLGDRTLVEPEARPIQVAATKSAKGRANLVLLRFPSKDKSCPAHFRVADLSRGNEPRVSDEFGNCSARPRASASGGGWKLAFARSGKSAARTWIYSNGELREAGKKAGSKASAKASASKVPPSTKVPEYTGPQ